ncbi:MAG: ABC transporter permease [Actinomycetota bacterium]|nr:ABC transporter permease [Actinomycetota bacterium]
MGGAGTIYRRINLRHTFRHRLRAFLTVAGIAAGVALTFSISVINTTLLTSFRSSIRDLAGSAELEVAAVDQAGLPERTVDEVEAVPGVQRAIPLLRATARISGFEGGERVLVLGATPEFSTLAPKGLAPASQIRIELEGDASGILLAVGVAEELGVEPGDRVAVETPQGTKPVTVSGTLAGGPVDLINGGNVALMLLPNAQELFDKVARVDSVYVVVDPQIPPEDIEVTIEERLQGAAIVGPPGERGQGLERVFSSLATLLSMGGTVALFVALFVVYNTMSMSLAERRREISMVLAFGAHRRAVFAAFLAEAALLGAVASLLGILGGYALASVLVGRAVEAYRFLPLSAGGAVVVPQSAVLVAMTGGLAVSLAGAFIPARRVLRVAPVESLRPDAAYEWVGAEFGRGSRGGLSIAVGLGGLSASILSLLAFLFVPEQKWIVTVGLLFGLTGVTFLLPHIVPLAIRIVRPFLLRGFGPLGRLASDALAKNPGRSTFTVAALVLTLGLVVAVASALGSYESQVERTAGAVIGAPLYVTSESYTGVTSDQPLSLSAREELATVPGVDYVYPLRFSLLDFGERQTLVYAVPVREVIERGVDTDLEAVGRDPDAFLEGLSRGEVVVSNLTAEARGLGAGDTVALPTPNGRRDFRIAGVFDDLVSFDSLYIHHDTYLRYWDDDKVDQFGILLEPGAEIADVKASLEQRVTGADLPARVLTKDQVLGRILDTIEGTFSLANGIQLAALVVAALTIANTMFTAILERRWEMGLERAIGMSGKQLARTVLLEAGAIGVIGGVGGAVLGTVSGYFMTQAMEAEFAWRVAFEVPWLLMAGSVALGIVGAAAAGFGPSKLAVRAPIIESLRYE